uniref:Malate dehydrogenase n=1 Tax=Haptolina brevifila TaxID=156173 RepID=A0A7S2INJ7_9EUKA|mmetsp:Transcript_69003/g.136787  ORF Transcript_69003/g.136787 Transcript_69003/m.136787 type:complete len:328 (+) Transcript_69003:63-1046(+)
MAKAPIIVCVTGAGGQIAYSLLPSLLTGSVFGEDQPLMLHLLDIPPSMMMLSGVKMELEDLANPLYAGSICTTDPNEGFKDADYIIFLGSFPRREGMERMDVMERNVAIFASQGKALQCAKAGVKCLVVGNPANTNAAILSEHAPQVPKANISALTRLDHNRARSMLSIKKGAPLHEVEGVIIWGNHSSTQYPDVRHATISGAKALDAVPPEWCEGEFLTTVQKRGAAIIAARKLSSAASAAKAICDHMHDWVSGTLGKMVSMAVDSTGNSYGVPDGLFYSFPVTCADGKWTIVDGLPIDDFSRNKMDVTAEELAEELGMARSLITS